MENRIGTYCNTCRLPYCICDIKQPKQVEVNKCPTCNGEVSIIGDTTKFMVAKQVDTVELIKYLDECIESCNKRLNEFKTGKMDYSYYGSMAMMSAYNNVKQFIKEQNNETK